eukprot:GHVH01001925.1.p1 GENE.GHVH01001925.1~~GHVH01001925.1.p1  ORF type:complete len:785 (+),score=105.90 GHVH01001925.1:125-2479(+)
MGIATLFNFIKDTAKSAVALHELSGKTVGIDTSCVLHRFVTRCAEKLLTDGKTDIYAKDVLQYAEKLRQNGVTAIFVFDGCKYPLKDSTSSARLIKRQDARSNLVSAPRNNGKLTFSKDLHRNCLKAVEVTQEMNYRTRLLLLENGFQCIVAPYEADGQLAVGCRMGWWWAVVSEDSDILVMGAPRLITKFKNDTGEMYTYKNIPADLTSSGSLIEKGMPFDTPWRSTFAPSHFILGCLLGGCDYVDNVSRVGIRRGFNFIRDSRGSVTRALKLVRMEYPSSYIPADYEKRLRFALWGFYTHLVFDPSRERLVLCVAKESWDDEAEGSIRCVDVDPISHSTTYLRQILPCSTAAQDSNDAIWRDYLIPEKGNEDQFFEDLAVQLGLVPNKEVEKDQNESYLLKLHRFCLQGDIHSKTLEKFPLNPSDPLFLDHPTFINRNIGSQVKPGVEKSRVRGRVQENMKFKGATAKSPGVPPASPADNTLVEYFISINKQQINGQKKDRTPESTPLTEQALKVHSAKFDIGKREFNVRAYLSECQVDLPESKIVADLTILNNSICPQLSNDNSIEIGDTQLVKDFPVVAIKSRTVNQDENIDEFTRKQPKMGRVSVPHHSLINKQSIQQESIDFFSPIVANKGLKREHLSGTPINNTFKRKRKRKDADKTSANKKRKLIFDSGQEDNRAGSRLQDAIMSTHPFGSGVATPMDPFDVSAASKASQPEKDDFFSLPSSRSHPFGRRRKQKPQQSAEIFAQQSNTPVATTTPFMCEWLYNDRSEDVDGGDLFK